uniref:Notch n=1 Tax=Tetraselmis sp. GSL018 TaxID=582737 RepID=A0A061R841_9CHLO|mmetsp:Transcript_32706/g.77568  ORF Transcript_32706/g.77568 Transcript_32706/m.77568 type:complete len:260 (-) Transcript_32706:195-974(-)
MLSALWCAIGGSDRGAPGVDTNNGTSYDDHKGYLYSTGYGELRNFEDDESLVTAVKSGNLRAVKGIVSEGADPTIKDELGRSPVHIAVRKNLPDILAALMPLNPDLNARDNHGLTPLHIASGLGNKSMVRRLLELGASADCTDAEGKTPAHIACAATGDSQRLAERIDVLGILVLKMSDLDFRDDDGEAPLHVATREGNIGAVRLLLQAGATRSLPNKNDKRPYEIASDRGYQQIMRILKEEDHKAQAKKLQQYEKYIN